MAAPPKATSHEATPRLPCAVLPSRSRPAPVPLPFRSRSRPTLTIRVAPLSAPQLLCMVCNLVLAPCMLLTFADTFSHTRGCCGGDGGCCSTCKTSSRHLGGLPTLSDLDIDSNAPLMRVVATERWKNGHHRLAASLTRFPYNLISLAVVYACFAWGSSALAHLSLSLGVQFAPADTAAAHAFASVQSTSPFDQSGVFASPFAILAHNVSGATSLASAALAGVGFEGGDEGGGIEGGGIEGTTSLFTQSYFGATCALARSLAEVPGVVPTSLQGIAFRALGGAVECLRAADAIELVGVMDASYLYTLRQLTNVASAADRPLNASDYFAATASVLTFAPSFYPFSTRSVALVDDVYDALDTAESEPASGGLSLSVFHPIVAEVAAEQYTTARLPWVLAVTLGLCFLIIALFFQAVFIPLKLLLTVLVRPAASPRPPLRCLAPHHLPYTAEPRLHAFHPQEPRLPSTGAHRLRLRPRCGRVPRRRAQHARPRRLPFEQPRRHLLAPPRLDRLLTHRWAAPISAPITASTLARTLAHTMAHTHPTHSRP